MSLRNRSDEPIVFLGAKDRRSHPRSAALRPPCALLGALKYICLAAGGGHKETQRTALRLSKVEHLRSSKGRVGRWTKGRGARSVMSKKNFD